MNSCFHETRETVDLLRRVVDKLDEKNGCISAEDLWDGVQCVPFNVTSSDPAVARHGIRQMEKFAEVLQSFTSRLASTYLTHTSTTRRTHIPPLNVESLPTEIIQCIMKDAIDCMTPVSLIRLSHISSKIRNTILDSPSLWVSIPLTLETPLSIIATIMSRSAALGLTVSISLYEGTELFYKSGSCKLSPTSVVSKLSTVCEHHQRWKELSISSSRKATNFILEHFPRVTLSSIRVLRLGRFSGSEFSQKWEFSPLEELHWGLQDRFPPSSMATQTLRVCSLPVYDSNVLMKTAAFLNAASNLHSLKLHLYPCDDDDHWEFPEIRLTGLQHLDIHICFHDDDGLGPVAILLKSILCPGLKSLSLDDTTLAEYSDLTENMRERYPLLTIFTLCINSGDPLEDFFFDDILRPLPSTIKNIRVKTRSKDANLHAPRRNSVIPYDFCNQYPDLTHLDLEDCTIPGHSFYTELSDFLKSLRISLNYFRPGRRSRVERTQKHQWEKHQEESKNAILTLQRAGVLVDSN